MRVYCWLAQGGSKHCTDKANNNKVIVEFQRSILPFFMVLDVFMTE